MSGLEGPDVRAGGVGLVALGFGGVWISRAEAGCPGLGEAPDVRGLAGCPAAVESFGVRLSLVFFWLVAPDVRAPAGCPVAVATGTSSFSFLCLRARLALVLGFSMVSSCVPEW